MVMAENQQVVTKVAADRYLKHEILGEGTNVVVYKTIDAKQVVTKVVADRYLKIEVLGEGTNVVVYKTIDTEGSSDIDQLGKLFAQFGTPKASQWPDKICLPDYVEFGHADPKAMRTVFPMASDDALDLFSKMFTYYPKVRITAHQVLEHRYFTVVPLPAYPASLPRPPRKGDSLDSKFLVSNPQDGPIAFSLPKRQRRIMPNPGDESGESSHHAAKFDAHVNENRLLDSLNSSWNDSVPMSVDSSAFVFNLYLWRNGFSINNGPLRSFDAENEPFLEAIYRDECPREMEPLDIKCEVFCNVIEKLLPYESAMS